MYLLGYDVFLALVGSIQIFIKREVINAIFEIYFFLFLLSCDK